MNCPISSRNPPQKRRFHIVIRVRPGREHNPALSAHLVASQEGSVLGKQQADPDRLFPAPSYLVPRTRFCPHPSPEYATLISLQFPDNVVFEVKDALLNVSARAASGPQTFSMQWYSER